MYQLFIFFYFLPLTTLNGLFDADVLLSKSQIPLG